MKLSTILLLAMLALICISCEDEPEMNNIPATWRMGNTFVDGIGTNSGGTVQFNEDLTGEMDFWVLVEADTFAREGVFSYTESRDSLFINLDRVTTTATNDTMFVSFQEENLAWEIRESLADALEVEFGVNVDQTEYSVILDMELL